MKLIILLICIALQGLLDINLRKRPYYWIDRYAVMMKTPLRKFNLDSGRVAVIGLLIPVLIVMLMINALIGSINTFYFIFSVLILLLCLDFRDINKQLSDYFSAFDQGNLVRAQIEAEKFIEHPIHQDKGEICRAVTEKIFNKSLSGIFAVIFWFMFLGPFGAIMYYFIKSITERSQRPDFVFPNTYSFAQVLKEVLDWLPVRLVTLTFAFISHFGPVFSLWFDRLAGGLLENRQLLIDGGLTALNLDLNPSKASVSENKQALHLVSRTVWAFVIASTVLTIASWL